MIGRVNAAHGALACLLFVDVCDQPRHARHHKEGVAQFNGDVQVEEHRRHRAVHIDRQRLAGLPRPRITQRGDHRHGLPGDARFGGKIEQAQRYFEQWYGAATLEWLERFHYRKTDDLELLATVDMAMVDLAANGESADVTSVKRVIAAHPEWLPKLSRELFSDKRIAAAIAECQTLFGG